MTKIEVRKIAPALGAEIQGVDLFRPLDNEAFATIHQAFLDHLVIFFRDQTLTPPQQAVFARRFGKVGIHSHIKSVPEQPGVIALIKEEADAINVGGYWHSDGPYLERTTLGSMLYAKEIPPVGGDTMFANMYLAYETLSPGMKEMLGRLRALNTGPRTYNPAFADTRAAANYQKIKVADASVEQQLTAVHPVVRTHPESGRKALYVNAAHTVRFDGMTDAESAPLLKYLYSHACQPEFTCRFQWRVGSLAFWDNRCAHHFAVNDYAGQRRIMHRVTIEGDRPF